tara:strand:- start:879 stop:1817 length:939 start_codon:yes stop_codon:yes gene_type:complete
MGITYNILASCDEIDKSKFSEENWYLLAWGMGDAMNQVLFLEGQSPVPYKILCPPRNFNAIKFVLENFVPQIPSPKCNQIDIYPLQDGYPIPQEEVAMSLNGFDLRDVFMAQGGSGSSRWAHDIGKLKVVHMAPRYWHLLNNLYSSGIYHAIESFGKKDRTIKEKTCILFPERGDSYQFPDSFWEDIVSHLKEKGYKIYVNSTNKLDVYKKEKIFVGTEKLDKPNLQDLFNFIIEHENLITIGQRSGIFDALKYFDFRKIIFYPDVDDSGMVDKERTNDIESITFEGDPHAKNIIDLCLSTYDRNVLNLIIP